MEDFILFCKSYRNDIQRPVKLGESEECLAINYMGIISQSNWDSELDILPRKKRPIKKLWNRLRGRMT